MKGTSSSVNCWSSAAVITGALGITGVVVEVVVLDAEMVGGTAAWRFGGRTTSRTR